MEKRIVFVHVPNSIETCKDGPIVYKYPLEAVVGATFLQEQGYECVVCDLQLLAHEQGIQTLANQLLMDNPAILCFLGMANLTPALILLIKAIRSSSQVTIGLSGYAVELIDQLILKSFPEIDFIIRSNNFSALHSLAQQLHSKQNWEGIPYLTYNDAVTIHQVAGNDEHLMFSGIQDLSLIQLDKYLAPASFASQGCTNQCTFCKRTSLYGKRYWLRTAHSVYEECAAIMQHPLFRKESIIQFQDDVFAVNAQHGSELCKLFITHGMHPWGCFNRVDKVDESYLQLLADAGCVSIFFGLESGSDRILQSVNKGFSVEQAKKTIEMAIKYIPQVMVSFIWGFPGETDDEFIQTIELAKWVHDKGVCVRSFAPLMLYPGTSFFYQYIDKLKKDKVYSSNMIVFDAVPISQAEQDLIAGHPEIFSPYYYLITDGFYQKADIADLFIEKFNMNQASLQTEFSIRSST